MDDLYKNFPNTCFYWLHDPFKKWWAFPIVDSKIEETNEKKYWIFFTPNWDFALSDNKRIKQNAINKWNIYCVFLDKDIKDEFRKTIWLEPSIIVETKRWFHAYWLVNNLYPVSWYIDMWEETMNWFCEMAEADRWAKDISRLMRLPWTKYWKDNSWTLINVIKYNPEIKYSLEELHTIWAKVAFVEKKEITNRKKYFWDFLYTFDEINKIAVEDVLNDISWWKYSCRWNDIYEDWKETSWYKKHPSKNYVITFSPHDERPEWWPFAVAKFLLWSAKDAFDYFNKRYWLRINIEKKIEVSMTSDEDEKKKIEIKSWQISIEFSEEDWRIILYQDDQWIRELFDWYFFPLWFYTSNKWINIYIIEYKSKNWQRWITFLSELWKTNELEKQLSRIWITFFWKKLEKQLIISFIQSTRQKYIMIDKLWIYSKDFIISKWWVYTQEYKWQQYFINITNIRKDWEIFEDYITLSWNTKIWAVKNTIEKLKATYNPEISITLFIIYWITLFAKFFRDNKIPIPNVFLVWLTQSWKTSLRRKMMDIYWITKSVEFSANITEFVAMKMLWHYVPINIWEFSNDSIRFDWDSLLKNLYDWTANSRWTNTQELINYPSNWWCIMDWESRTMTNSVFSRSIMLFMNPQYRKENIDNFENINWYFINNMSKLSAIERFLKSNKEYLTKESKWITKAEKDRIIDNYALLLSFAECFDLLDDVKEYIKEYMLCQLDMMWEDNHDKIIRTVLVYATMNENPAEFIEDSKWRSVLRIEVQFDLTKSWKQIQDLVSSMQLVNHHFWYVDTESETLYVPIDYIMRNKPLHLSLNRFLDYYTKLNSYIIPPKVVWAIMQYASTNWYTKSRFYDNIDRNDYNYNKNKSTVLWEDLPFDL